MRAERRITRRQSQEIGKRRNQSAEGRKRAPVAIEDSVALRGKALRIATLREALHGARGTAVSALFVIESGACESAAGGAKGATGASEAKIARLARGRERPGSRGNPA